MPNNPLPLKLSPEEERFLRHWIYDEAHYQEGTGRAKRLQLQHGAVPADLATLAAAALPDPAAQEGAARGPVPTGGPTWPWTEERLRDRVAEAQAALAEARRGATTNEAGDGRRHGISSAKN